MTGFLDILDKYPAPNAAAPKLDPTPQPDGNITLTPDGRFLLVQWGNDARDFKGYVQKARDLKTATKSYGWNPRLPGWVINPTAALAVIDAYPTFRVDDRVNALAGKVPQAEVKPTEKPAGPTRTIHVDQNTVTVAWNNVKPDEFRHYLDTARNLGTGRYVKDKGWVYPAASLPRIRAAFPGFEWTGLEHAVEHYAARLGVPDSTTARLKEAAEQVVNSPLPSGRTLYQHQKDGVVHAVTHRDRPFNGHRPKGEIIADDMGLGKTTTALLSGKAHQIADPEVEVLVIAPKSVVRNWKKEAAGCGVNITVVSWSKIPATKMAGTNRDGKPIEWYEPDTTIKGKKYVLIADEGQNAQCLKSARTRQFLALAKYATAVYPLSGTPMKNGRPINMLALLVAIDHGLAQDKKGYKLRYCDAHWEKVKVRDEKTGRVISRQIWKEDGATNLDELRAAVKPNILRRTKAECLDLPAKTRMFVPVEASTKVQAEYDQTFERLRAEYYARLHAGEVEGTAAALVLLNNLRRAAEVAKVDTVCDLIEETLGQDDQAVVFFEFHDAAQAVADRFAVQVFDGQTSQAARDRMVNDFQTGRQKVFVGMGQAGGVGITLTKGRTVILASRPWTPGDAVQREDRCHRIGQTGTVTALWVQFGNIDEKVDKVLIEKEGNINEVLAGQRTTLVFEPNDLVKLAGQVLTA